MKCKAMTEEEMNEHEVPWFETQAELMEYVNSLIERKHDYGTYAMAISLASTAMFNYMSSLMGATGFQAGAASLDIMRRTKSIDGPFIIVKAVNELYPQYNNERMLRDFINGPNVQEWLANKAKEKMEQNADRDVHPDVMSRWKEHAKRLED